MTPSHETILSVIPGNGGHQRLVVSMRVFAAATAETEASNQRADEGILSMGAEAGVASSSCCEGCAGHENDVSEHRCSGSMDKPIILRQETFSSAVGWFTQSCVEMTLDQWAAMKSALAVTIPETSPPVNQRKRRLSTTTTDGSPVILSFDEHAAIA
ncbi:MAG: hypothetical protein AAF670_06415 [Planctomycetota bacterium]